MREPGTNGRSSLTAFALLLSVPLVLLLFAVLFSLYVEVATTALEKVGLSKGAIRLTLLAIVVGGFVNIPIHRARILAPRLAEWTTFYVNWGTAPFPIDLLSPPTIAVNIGGCVVPVAVALAVLPSLVSPFVLGALLIAVWLNIVLCYRMGMIVRHRGILLPMWASPFVGLVMAWGLLPQGSPLYAAFAFVVAVAGPLVGADLLHLREVQRMHVGTMSIGGAGPVDGILLSGLLAAWLA